jgi:Protein of unknown function (DUF3301).
MGTLLTILLVSLALFWFWSDSLRARERALRACDNACTELHVQLLDQTVALSALGLRRGRTGRIHLERVYTFEFSADGVARCKGWAALRGTTVEYVHMDHPGGGTFLEQAPTGNQNS